MKALKYKLVEKSPLPIVIYSWVRGKNIGEISNKPTIIIFKQVLNVCMLRYIIP